MTEGEEMKNTTIAIIIIILAAGVGFYFFIQQNPSTESGKEKMMEKSSDSTMMDKSGSSRYVEYSQKILDNSTSKRRVLYFYANWCPTCRPADANFQENSSKIPDDVVLIRVNCNDSDTDAQEKALVEKYGVTYQHTFVQIDESGNEVTKWNGGQIEELLANVK